MRVRTMPDKRTEVGAAGFTVKSGWAAAALVSISAGTPLLLSSCRVDLSDPAHPEGRQPFHAGFGTARQTGDELSALVESVRVYGTSSMRSLLQTFGRQAGLARAGIVVGSLIDPERIGNEHIRIHALEGRLFRTIVESGLTECGLAYRIWLERELFQTAETALRRSSSELRALLAGLGRPGGGPWRKEEKMAALAAWLSWEDRQAAP